MQRIPASSLSIVIVSRLSVWRRRYHVAGQMGDGVRRACTIRLRCPRSVSTTTPPRSLPAIRASASGPRRRSMEAMHPHNAMPQDRTVRTALLRREVAGATRRTPRRLQQRVRPRRSAWSAQHRDATPDTSSAHLRPRGQRNQPPKASQSELTMPFDDVIVREAKTKLKLSANIGDVISHSWNLSNR